MVAPYAKVAASTSRLVFLPEPHIVTPAIDASPRRSRGITRLDDVAACERGETRSVAKREEQDDEGQANFLKNIGAELIRGHARLAGARRVAVETPDGTTITLTARHAVPIGSALPSPVCAARAAPGRSP